MRNWWVRKAAHAGKWVCLTEEEWDVCWCLAAVLLTQGLCMTEYPRWSRDGQCSLNTGLTWAKMAVLNENVNVMNCVCKCVMKCVLRCVLDYHGACKTHLRKWVCICIWKSYVFTTVSKCMIANLDKSIWETKSVLDSKNRRIQPYWKCQQKSFQVLGCKQLSQMCVQHVLQHVVWVCW